MKAFSTARTAILELFETSRAASANYPTDAEFPIEIRNRRFQKPASGPWGRLTFIAGERTGISVGAQRGAGNLSRTPFILTLQIFVPEHDGEKLAFQIAEEIFSGMDWQANVRTDGAGFKVHTVCTTASFTPVGKAASDSDEGSAGFEQFNATMTGHYDDYAANVIASDPIIESYAPLVYLKRDLGYTASPAVTSWENQGTGADASGTGDFAVNVGAGLVFPMNEEFTILSNPTEPFTAYVIGQVLDVPPNDFHFLRAGNGAFHVGMQANGTLFMQEALLGTKVSGSDLDRAEFVIGAEFNGASSRLFVGTDAAVSGSLSVSTPASGIIIGSGQTFAAEPPPVLIRDVVLIEGAHDESAVMAILRNR